MEDWQSTPVEETMDPKVLHAVFANWFVQRIYGSPVAQATAAFNYLREVLPELESSVLAAIKKG